MLKRELKLNLKSFLLWTSALLIMFLVVFLMYPSIINSENITMMEEMMKMFPEEVLKALNMDISSIDTAFGWLKSEGFVFIILLTGIYSSILGSNILLKEESEGTISYLHSLPIKRKNILFGKIVCSLIYIIIMVLGIGIFNYICLEISGDFDRLQYILLSITPLFSCLCLFSISLFISTFFKKTKKVFGLCLGIALVSYLLSVISEISDVTEFLKLFTVYTLCDIRNVILNVSIDPLMIVISMVIFIVFTLFAFVRFERKDLV